AAAAERGDLVVRAHALEAGDDDDLARLKGGAHALSADSHDPRFRVRGVGHEADLRAGKGARLEAEGVERHGQERDRDLLAGREQHVRLARVGRRGDLVGERDEAVRRLAMAETTTTSRWPPAVVSATRRATFMIFCASATDEPPYFWTIT